MLCIELVSGGRGPVQGEEIDSGVLTQKVGTRRRGKRSTCFCCNAFLQLMSPFIASKHSPQCSGCKLPRDRPFALHHSKTSLHDQFLPLPNDPGSRRVNASCLPLCVAKCASRSLRMFLGRPMTVKERMQTPHQYCRLFCISPSSERCYPSAPVPPVCRPTVTRPCASTLLVALFCVRSYRSRDHRARTSLRGPSVILSKRDQLQRDCCVAIATPPAGGAPESERERTGSYSDALTATLSL